MHELVMRIGNPDLCYVFARNAISRGHPELALQAYRRAVDLRTENYETDCEVERAAVRSIYAYEAALSHNKGKRTRATGTWQLVNRHGVVAAVVKRLESRGNQDFTPELRQLGMADYSFTAVRDAYPDAFHSTTA